MPRTQPAHSVLETATLFAGAPSPADKNPGSARLVPRR